MALNPLQVLGVSSLVIVGSGIASWRLFTSSEGTEDVISSKILNASTRCNVYVVTLSPDKKSVTEITESGGNLRSFLKRHIYSDGDFIKNQEGCKNGFENMYVYREQGKLIYSLDLQKTDGYVNRLSNGVKTNSLVDKS